MVRGFIIELKRYKMNTIIKGIMFLTVGILLSTNVKADGREYFDYVIRQLYQKGLYEEALQGLDICNKYYSEELNTGLINDYIVKCKTKISDKKAVEEANKQVARAAEKVKEELERLEKRKEDKLLYLSSSAFNFKTEYTGMHSAIKGFIAQNSDLKFSDNPEMACWCVYVTANAKEAPSNGENDYNATVCAYVKIVDEIQGVTIYEDEIVERRNSKIDYQAAANRAYRGNKKQKGINEKVSDLVLEYCR